MSFLQEYTLLGELGQGGFAKVYKVRHNELGYIRAIRVLNEPVTDEKSRTYQKFLRECKVLLRLGNGIHPNIVHIYQPRLLENHALVEMDFVDGMDLLHYLNANGNFIPVDEVLRMVKEISSALAYCHEDIYKFCMDRMEDNLQDDPNDGSKVLINEATRRRLIEKYKVIHNDIHSGNIIRREDGSFVLLDFGLAITDGADVRNSSRHENGAMEYKAPEKWEDDTILTEQSDVYSFGIVMYEYLAGRVPFPFDVHDSNRARSVFALWEAHKSQTPPPIFDIRKAYFEENNPGQTYKKDYPDWLEETIMKCLEKDPAKRFKNGKELNEYVCKRLDEQDTAALRSSNQSLSEENEQLKARLRQAEEEAKRRIEALEREAKERIAKLAQENHSLAGNLQQNPVRDLRSVIGINDKFLFVNELFGGSMEKYNESIEELNDLKTLTSAMTYLNELKIELKWKSNNEAYQRLSELVKRKFKRIYTIVLPEDGLCVCNKTEVFERETAKLTYQKSGMNSQTVTITGGYPSPYCLVDVDRQEMLILSGANANIRFTRNITITCSDQNGHTYDNFGLRANDPAVEIDPRKHTITISENYKGSFELYLTAIDNSFKQKMERIHPTQIFDKVFDVKVESRIYQVVFIDGGERIRYPKPMTPEEALSEKWAMYSPIIKDDERVIELTVPSKTNQPSFVSIFKKYWYVILLSLLLIYAAWGLVSVIGGNGWPGFGKKEAPAPTVTRQQLIDNMSTSDTWQRDQIPQDLRSLVYDNLCSGNVSMFFSDAGNGNKVCDTLFNYGHAKINPKWKLMIEDLSVIHADGTTKERNDIRSKIREICAEAGCVDLARIVQATSSVKNSIAERKRNEQSQLMEADLEYMKRNDSWTRINLKTEECQMLFDKIVEGDMDYLLQIAQNIDNQPKEKTNGYWIAICHEITAMQGDDAKLARAQNILTTNCANGRINLKDLWERIRSINNPNPDPKPKPNPNPPIPPRPNPNNPGRRPSSN